MPLRRRVTVRAVMLLGMIILAGGGGRTLFGQPLDNESPEQRAATYLAAEVPKWHRENACYSCHNNGDAARALFLAKRADLVADGGSFRDTLAFLAMPDRWDANGPDGPFKDQKLAHIQFAAALAESDRSGLIAGNKSALRSAARLVAELQNEDGSWSTDAAGTVGSPVTYGQALATYVAADVLGHCGSAYSEAVARAQAWFAGRSPKSILDASATLLALADVRSPIAGRRREEALRLIREGQSTDGGWGPFTSSPSEVFDTALVVLALQAQPNRHDYAAAIARGRKYLVANQQADGGWEPTTRPRGIDSYAQQMSTTGWALEALLATKAPPKTVPRQAE